MRLHNLKSKYGSKKRKRVGRGPGSGHGGYSTRGRKGQKARSAGKGPSFEGGQTPLVRRIPKRGGFKNIFKKQYAIVNLSQLKNFEENTEVKPELLIEVGIIKKIKDGIKILGDGNLEKPLKVFANKFSESAKKKITEAGGEAIII